MDKLKALEALRALLKATDALIEIDAAIPDEPSTCCLPTPWLQSLTERCWGNVARAILMLQDVFECRTTQDEEHAP